MTTTAVTAAASILGGMIGGKGSSGSSGANYDTRDQWITTLPQEVTREWNLTPEQQSLLSSLITSGGKVTADQSKLLGTAESALTKAMTTGTGAIGKLADWGGYAPPSTLKALGEKGYAPPSTLKALGEKGYAPPSTLRSLGETPYKALPELSAFAEGQYTRPDAYMRGTGKRLVDTWREEILPELRGELGMKGLFYGSGRIAAEDKSAKTLMDTLSEGLINWETAGRKQQLSALGTLTESQLAGKGLQAKTLTSYGGLEMEGIGSQIEALGKYGELDITGIRSQIEALGKYGELDMAGLSQKLNALLGAGKFGISAGGTLSDIYSKYNEAALGHRGLLQDLLGVEPYTQYPANVIVTSGEPEFTDIDPDSDTDPDIDTDPDEKKPPAGEEHDFYWR